MDKVVDNPVKDVVAEVAAYLFSVVDNCYEKTSVGDAFYTTDEGKMASKMGIWLDEYYNHKIDDNSTYYAPTEYKENGLVKSTLIEFTAGELAEAIINGDSYFIEPENKDMPLTVEIMEKAAVAAYNAMITKKCHATKSNN